MTKIVEGKNALEIMRDFSYRNQPILFIVPEKHYLLDYVNVFKLNAEEYGFIEYAGTQSMTGKHYDTVIFKMPGYGFKTSVDMFQFIGAVKTHVKQGGTFHILD